MTYCSVPRLESNRLMRPLWVQSVFVVLNVMVCRDDGRVRRGGEAGQCRAGDEGCEKAGHDVRSSRSRWAPAFTPRLAMKTLIQDSCHRMPALIHGHLPNFHLS